MPTNSFAGPIHATAFRRNDSMPCLSFGTRSRAPTKPSEHGDAGVAIDHGGVIGIHTDLRVGTGAQLCARGRADP